MGRLPTSFPNFPSASVALPKKKKKMCRFQVHFLSKNMWNKHFPVERAKNEKNKPIQALTQPILKSLLKLKLKPYHSFD